jgi:hypothetical protein
MSNLEASDLRERTETLGQLAARQMFVTTPLQAAIDKHGAEHVIISVTRPTMFGEFLMGWREVDAALEQASSLIQATYTAHGRGTLSCDCGAWEAVVDADCSSADVLKVRDLIEHARFDHVSPRAVIYVRPIVVLDTARQEPTEAERAVLRDAAGLAPRDSFSYGR